MRFGAVALGLLLVLSVNACQGPTKDATAPRYEAKAFFETTRFRLPGNNNGYAFSPDRSKVLISSDSTGVFNVYALPTSGGDPVALTASKDNATFGASYFPADERILFTADQGGNELTHVYVRETDGSVKDLTPGAKVKADFLGWNAAGDNFYLISNERDPQAFDVYAYGANGYGRRLVFKNPGFTVSDISRDGRWVALVKPRTSANSDVYLADLSGDATPKLITPHQGNIAYDVYGFTPDGGALIFATDEHGEFNQAWTHNLSTGEKAKLIAADWDVMAVGYSKSGRYRVQAINADASTQVAITNVQGRKDIKLTGVPAGDLGNVRFSPDEKQVAFSVASDTSPSDVFVADLETGQARRLTKASNPAIDETQLVQASIARFKSYDGLEIPGVLYRPKGASAKNPAHAVVFVHGGPGDQSRRGY
jgi:Tol biopolymer transport system component